MKSEEKSIKAISAQAHGEAADNRLLRHKLREKDELISDLRAQIENLNRNLSEKVSQMADMMDKLVAFMMGRGDVTLSDSLREAVIAGVRAEYEMRERKLKEEFSKQLGNLTSEFEARLAAKDNEINALKGEDGGEGGNTPSTSLPKDTVTVTPEEMAARKYYHVNLPDKYKNCMGRTQVTESLITQILTMHFYYGMTLGEIESWLKGMGLNFAHSTVMNWIEKSADILEPLDKPLQKEITTHSEVHGDETTVKGKDKRLAAKGEKEEDVEDDLHYFKRWIFCYYAPLVGLTQFVFHERGRRTQEAVQKYFEDVIEKLYLHSDGAPIYKCYDTGELIVRIACLVHMRRPFYKLKDVSIDAMKMLKIFEDIFKEDRNIKESFTNPDDITRERVLRIAPLLNEMKSYLDKLKASLSAEVEPELLKAVNYALTEYPCMLRCLEDGSLDLSNNICERQIRRIAKYRNNSFFVGSPEAGVRFARLMSVFANIRNHNLDPVEYLCDVFRRIKNTANDKLVELLAHRWQPATVSAWV